MSASACSRALRVAGGRPTRRVTSSRRLRAYDNSREGGQQDDSSADYGRERGEDLEEQRALDELRSEFAQVVKQNWDGLQLQGKDELSERYQDEFGVEIWLEKDIPEEPKEEAEELFDWWNDLDDVYVLIFQLHSDEDGIFTLKDSSASSEEEDSNNNFILSFESAEEAASYAVKLSDSLQGLKAEIECMERDELLQLCKELEVGIRIVQEGGEEPDIPSYVHVDELEDIRQSLESLLPPDEE